MTLDIFSERMLKISNLNIFVSFNRTNIRMTQEINRVDKVIYIILLNKLLFNKLILFEKYLIPKKKN